MSISSFVRACSTAALLLIVASHSLAVDSGEDWLRGSGKSLEICLRGEVFQPDGRPAADIEVDVGMNTASGVLPLKPTVDGSQFEVWIPVNRQKWHSMWLGAASSDGSLVGYERFARYRLRQAANEGIKLTMQSPTKPLKVKVTDQGQAVAGAFVKVELGYGINPRARSDADGIASFGLLATQEPSRITAWTDDFRVGGFSFSRKPTRDPHADLHEVELSNCRNQKLRFVDENGAPIPSVTFLLQMATLPNYNYIGTHEYSKMTTDENGEVMYEWFPDWDKHHFYPDLQTGGWVRVGDVETVGNVSTFKLKKGAERKRVSGRVVSTDTDVGGFSVTLRSFQGERENQSDVLNSFTDADGTFSLDVLPDATYCAWALDLKWVGEVTHLIPYHSHADEVTSPELAVRQGQQVQVIATLGPNKEPFANLGIHFRREHRFTWREDGRTRNGTGGPQWWGTTDANGIATTNALPGELKASVYTPMWRKEETAKIISGQPCIVRLHREVEDKRTVTGRLVLAEGLDSKLAEAEIKIGSVDGDYDDEQELTANADGSFSFETLSTEIGIFGCTQDGRAAGAMIVKDLDSPIALQLRPTIDYQGQLLGEADQPVVGHGVYASIRVAGEVDYNAGFATSFEARRMETKTDPQGNYTLAGLPSEMKVSIRADAIDDSGRPKYLDEVYLEPGEARPIAVNRLAEKTSAKTTPLANRYEKTLRDCELMGFRMMIITSADADAVNEFVDLNFVDHGNNKMVSTFMQIVLAGGAKDFPSADLAFLEERDWPLPGENRVFACAIDARGDELARLEIDIHEKGAADKAAAFVRKHAPAKLDAQKKWDEAFEQARNSQRKVWARISQRYCGPCFRMARWLDDHREVLAKDYVMLKIDNVRDENGSDITKRLTRGRHFGIPFHVIFDDEQEMLIDSEGPLGNIGHPSGFEGRKHLRKMLAETRQRLTDKEIDQLVASLGE